MKRGCDSLQLALVGEVELPARVVVREQDWPDRRRRVDLGGHQPACEAVRPGRHVQVELPGLLQWPAACDRVPLARFDVGAVARLALMLVRDVEVGTQEVDDLVVVGRDDRFGEGDEVRFELLQALREHGAPLRPVRAAAEEVLDDDAHYSAASTTANRFRRTRGAVTKTATTAPANAATAEIPKAAS